MNNKKEKIYDVVLKDDSSFSVGADKVIYQEHGVEFYKNDELEAYVTYESLAYFADFEKENE